MNEEATLEVGEPHPMAFLIKQYIVNLPITDLFQWKNAMGESDSRAAKICLSTLDRLLAGQPVSDRYIMGLGIYLMVLEGNKELSEAQKGQQIWISQN